MVKHATHIPSLFVIVMLLGQAESGDLGILQKLLSAGYILIHVPDV